MSEENLGQTQREELLNVARGGGSYHLSVAEKFISAIAGLFKRKEESNENLSSGNGQ